MIELRKIVLGEPVKAVIGPDDHKITTTTYPVLVDGAVIGSIAEIGDENKMCTWQADTTTFVIPRMTCWSRDSLLATLDAMVDRQAKRLAAGETLCPSDTNPLEPELQVWLDNGYLRHPLVYAVPYTEQMAPYYNTRLRLIRKQVEDALATGEWGRYIVSHERPYRLQALMEVVDRLADHEYWEMIGEFWTDSENIHQNVKTWRTLWSSKRPGREISMTDEEREALVALPDIVPIYRGFQHTQSARGMSWTLDRDKAVWFARRYAGRPQTAARVASAMVERRKILAHFIGRNEREIVVLSRDLKNVSIELIERKVRDGV